VRKNKLGIIITPNHDSVNVHEYDARDFGMASHEKALLLGLDVLRQFS
jgi:hypothetical protein